MRAWIEDLDDDHDVHVHAADYGDVKLVADYCAEMRAAGCGNGKDEKLAMTVDTWVIMDWCNKKGIEWGVFMRDPAIQTRFLDDPDNAPFRIWTGRI